MAFLTPEEGPEGKTEEGTSKKRTDSRKDGKVCQSQEVVTAAVLIGAVSIYPLVMPFLKQELLAFLQLWAQLDVTSEWSIKMVQRLTKDALVVAAVGVLPFGLTAILVSTIATVGQIGFFFETKPLNWKFSAFNPVKGAKQLFSKESIIKLAISLMKVCVISFMVWSVLRKQLMEMIFLYRLTVPEGVAWFVTLIFKIIWRIMLLFAFIAAVDWMKEKRKYERSIMMSKQEVKDERKNQESSPMVKRKIRQKMQEMSMARMMAAVPDATVVITNPTRLAIVVKYGPSMAAPIVVAKGKRLTAKRIRELAREHGVPILERKPLARAMYNFVEVGKPVPPNFYEAVAELMAYLFRIGNEHVRKQLRS